MHLRCAGYALPVVTLLAATAVTTPAAAVHLFPLFPGDPSGNCGTTLTPDPGGSATNVGVVGFSFTDERTKTATSEVERGEAVTWRWDLEHCHSVTFTSTPSGAKVPSTDGGSPAVGSQPQLVRPAGADSNTFTARFIEPGAYDYICAHHDSVGMVGSVLVR